MKSWKTVTAVLAAVLMMSSGVTVAKDKAANKAGCDQPSASAGTNAPPRLEGEVTKIDEVNKVITVRATDGTTHEFHAHPDDLKDLKVGDKLEAKRRDC